MDFQTLKDHLENFLTLDFDHELLSDPLNDPFVHISLLNVSLVNPCCQSFGQYLTKPHKAAVHTEFTTAIMATALVLEGKYLIQKPPRGEPVEDIAGCSRGISIGRAQIIIITVVTNPEDARFVCQSVILSLQTLIDH